MKKRVLGVLVGMFALYGIGVSNNHAGGNHGGKKGWAVMFVEPDEHKHHNGTVLIKGHVAQACTSTDGHHCTVGGKQVRTRHGEWKWFWLDGTRKAQLHFRLGTRHGESKTWYPNGQLRWVEQYAAGKLQGERRTFFANGKLKTVEHYANGTLHGKYNSWWWNGKAEQCGKYEHGKRQGLWRSWYISGHPKEAATYAQGTLHGPFAEWWYVCRPLGCGSVKMKDGFYQKGQKQGRWQQGSFDHEGQLISKASNH